MLFLSVKFAISHKWFRKTICSVDIILYSFQMLQAKLRLSDRDLPASGERRPQAGRRLNFY